MKAFIKRAAHAVMPPSLRRSRAKQVDELQDLSEETRKVISACRPFTLTSRARLAAVCGASEYVVESSIPGSFVECGVYKGGSCMAAAMTFQRLGRSDIDFYLYDTFEGMPEPTAADVDATTGTPAADTFGSVRGEGWCASPLDEVQSNLASTGYPAERLHYVKGLVEATIPAVVPDAISILRLDTDWYTSTKHELEHLFPLLSTGGVLIIDDYGHWMGARAAVDEYLRDNKIRLLLNRIDYTARIGVKL